jgi:DNA modification methylase
LLPLELGDLKELGFDLSLTGFGEIELGTLLADKTEGLTDPDDAPAVPEHPVTQPGDLWLLGRHRLLCGDSTSAADVERLLAGVAPHLMVTDPPYGVNYDPAWRNRAAAEGKIGQKKSTRAVGQVANDDRADWRDAWTLFPGTVAYVWHAGTKAGIVQDSLDACGFETRAQIVWAKNNFAIGRGHYHCKHEPCWYMVRKGGVGAWSGDRTQTTLWQIDKNLKSETGHGTQKPVECMKRPIENNSSPGQAIYEPFSGSGTTIIAAEMTGRACYAIEISPAHVDVAVKRWEEFSGKPATLDGDGRSFDQVAAERVAQSASAADADTA